MSFAEDLPHLVSGLVDGLGAFRLEVEAQLLEGIHAVNVARGGDGDKDEVVLVLAQHLALVLHDADDREGGRSDDQVSAEDRLIELELVERQLPFGESERSTKRSLYQISDPLLRFWFRFVEPNRSLLAAGKVVAVAKQVRANLAGHVASVWEDLARASAPRLRLGGQQWGAARRWWGAGLDRQPLEIDVVAASDDGSSLLLGEAKWSAPVNTRALVDELERKAERCPLANGKKIYLALWLKEGGRSRRGVAMVTPRAVMKALK